MKMFKTLVALAALCTASAAFAGKCTVTEFVQLPLDAAGRILYLADLGPSTPSQQVTYTTSTKITTALASSTNFVRIYCDAEARVKIGTTSVTATADDTGLPPAAWEYFHVNRGTSTAAFYVAIYDGTS